MTNLDLAILAFARVMVADVLGILLMHRFRLAKSVTNINSFNCDFKIVHKSILH